MVLFSAGGHVITVAFSVVTLVLPSAPDPNLIAPWGFGVISLADFSKSLILSGQFLSSIFF